MPKSRNHDREHEHEHRREHDSEHHKKTGDDPTRHAKIIERRWLGGLPPTAERYARALQQWRKLPGAVVRTATDIEPAAEAAKPAVPAAGESAEESES